MTVLSGGILFCVMLRWQPWITRLQLPFFVMMGPAIGTVLAERIRRNVIIVIGVGLVLGALPSMLLNQKRPLLGELPTIFGYRYRLFDPVPNIFTASVWQQMFEDNRQTYLAYLAAVATIANQLPLA